MRPLKESDLRKVLEWRNSEHVHSAMVTDHLITWEEHYNWYKKHEFDRPYFYFIFLYKCREVGYISYNDYDSKKNIIVDSGAYLGERNLPFVCGLALFFFVCCYGFECLGAEQTRAIVLDGNKTASFINKRLGYKTLTKEISYYKNEKKEMAHEIFLTKEVYKKKKAGFIQVLLKESKDKTIKFS